MQIKASLKKAVQLYQVFKYTLQKVKPSSSRHFLLPDDHEGRLKDLLNKINKRWWNAPLQLHAFTGGFTNALS